MDFYILCFIAGKLIHMNSCIILYAYCAPIIMLNTYKAMGNEHHTNSLILLIGEWPTLWTTLFLFLDKEALSIFLCPKIHWSTLSYSEIVSRQKLAFRNYEDLPLSTEYRSSLYCNVGPLFQSKIIYDHQSLLRGN